MLMAHAQAVGRPHGDGDRGITWREHDELADAAGAALTAVVGHFTLRAIIRSTSRSSGGVAVACADAS